MKLTKHKLHTITAALTLGTLSIGFSPAAMAVSTYDAAASLSLTLTDVTGTGGTTVTNGWLVAAIGDDFGGAFLIESGDATASGTTSVVDSTSMSILDSISQSSTASGTATNGFSSTDALTNLEMSVTNFSGQALTFSFDYDIIAIAAATGDDATANVLVELLGPGLGLLDLLAEASANSIFGPVSDSDNQSGSFNFTLGDGNSQIFTSVAGGFVDSIGTADAVPVPAAVWLFGSGLLGLVGVARRKKA